MGSDSLKVSIDQQLRLKSPCTPVAEDQLEPVLQNPQTKAMYTLLPREAAVLAYCWNLQYFQQDCQSRIFNILYASLHAQEADVSSSCPDGDTTVAALVHAVKETRWEPGLFPYKPIQDCFPAGTSTWCFVLFLCMNQHHCMSRYAQ